MRLALLSDIHANLPATEAVLADVRSRSIELLVCLGDVVTLGLQPAETIDLLARSHCRFVQGNHDQAVVDPALATSLHIPEFLVPSIEWSRSQLTDRQLDLTRRFEPVLRIDSGGRSVAFVHASPRSNHEGIPPTASDGDIAAVLDELATDVLAVGHTHCQMKRSLGKRVLINPGSVGSVFKVFPGGTEEPSLQPWAEYALLNLDHSGCGVEFLRIPFATKNARQAAKNSSSPDREWWLKQYS